MHWSMNIYIKPLQYCCLENPMDRGAWWATVHGVTKSNTTEHSWEREEIVVLVDITH